MSDVLLASIEHVACMADHGTQPNMACSPTEPAGSRWYMPRGCALSQQHVFMESCQLQVASLITAPALKIAASIC